MNPTYSRLTEGFKEWLHILGYAKSTVDTLPRRVNELFEHAEIQGIYKLSDIQSQHIKPITEPKDQEKPANRGIAPKLHVKRHHKRVAFICPLP